jgi:hypothetical protein
LFSAPPPTPANPFIPKKNRVDLLTYEVKRVFLVEETPHVKDRGQHQFMLSYAMAP